MLVQELALVFNVSVVVSCVIGLFLRCRGLPHGVFFAMANMIMCGHKILIQEVYAVCPVSLVITNEIWLYFFLAYHVYPRSILPESMYGGEGFSMACLLLLGISSIHGLGESISDGAQMGILV